jgi:hypothetical protein
MDTKTTTSIGFPNQDENMDMFSFKSKSQNKKHKDKEHNTCKIKIQQDFIAQTKKEHNKVVIKKLMM